MLWLGERNKWWKKSKRNWITQVHLENGGGGGGILHPICKHTCSTNPKCAPLGDLALPVVTPGNLGHVNKN